RCSSPCKAHLLYSLYNGTALGQSLSSATNGLGNPVIPAYPVLNSEGKSWLDKFSRFLQNTLVWHLLKIEYKMQRLGRLEAQLIAYCQSRGQSLITAGDLVLALRWTPEQERKVLSQLARKGLIARVRRGLYLVPSRLPVSGRWNPGEALALTTLMEDR